MCSVMFFRKLLAVAPRAIVSSAFLLSVLQARAADAGAKSGGSLSPREQAELAAKKIKIPAGFTIEPFAVEPQLQNPVCFAIDEKGRFYVAETFRHSDGVVDIRHHMNILEEELASQSVEDHVATIQKHLSELPNMTAQGEVVQFIEDTDGDGKADKSTVFADGFNNAVDGIGAGLLARNGDVFYTCIPSLYLFRDENGDGKADVKKVLQTGYGIRFAFIGHDLHGLRIGPDGKLYFSIGDRGFNVKQGDRDVAFPESGGVFRCNLDGSDLELFAYGMRNPQELAFDDYGNLFTGENNSDGGDQARWVYVVEGGDCGWRLGWQFITYPNNRGPWNSEKMWHPQNDDQPAYIVPPIANIGNGPSGLTHYPGVGFSTNYANHFFLCDFKGTGPRSEVHSFASKPKGASFELVDRKDFIADVLVTDCEFGPDSAMYITDWVEGWDKPGKGRIYRIADAEGSKDPMVAETKKLLAEGFDKRSPNELVKLLGHRDQRVRLEAQFALAAAGEKNIKALAAIAQKNENQLARIHAIWALGQIANAKKGSGNAKAADVLVPLLEDGDAEIRAQATKVLADARYAKALKALLKMVHNVDEPRGQFFAALALGKLGNKEAINPILEMLRANNDEDAYLRHAGATALVWIGDFDAIKAAAKDNSAAVRLAVAVAMRRLHHADVAALLDDKQQKVVLEAARAINDLPIIESLPRLAALIDRPNYEEPLFRRVLNANFRAGQPEHAKALATFAARKDAPEALRIEALEMLKEWKQPKGIDRVTGLWRPLAERDGKPAAEAFATVAEDLLKNAPAGVRIAAFELAQSYNFSDAGSAAFEALSNKQADARVRVAALKLLAATKDGKAAEAIGIATADADEALRKEAVALQATVTPAKASGAVSTALDTGTIGEKQTALVALGDLKDASADKILGEWMDKLTAGQVAPEVQLELITAAEKRTAPEVKAKVEKYNASRPNDDLGPFRECLSGGNADEGKKVFFEKVEASCVRCHKVKGEGGEVGPALDGIGSRQKREYLLHSIVNPNAEIAAGFESVMVSLKDGSAYAGTLKSEDDKEIKLNSPEDGLVTVKKSEVEKRERGMSGMPPDLGKILSKPDLRNLVEFLASQK